MSVKVKMIWYNPSAAAFEGRVDIRRGNRNFRYPCVVEGPHSMPTKDVRARMAAQAKRMSDSHR